MNNTRSCHYHLRFQLIPGEEIEERTKDLTNFCLKHAVEEVVLFVAGEEWNDGHLSDTDIDTWYRTLDYAKKNLQKAGLSVSLNIWATILHCDRGRRFAAGSKFSPMVSPSGRKAKACASFACPEWTKYITALYKRFSKLGFRTVWVEDDFRYHNHEPLDWGGDFNQLVINRFEKETGFKTDRKTLLDNILKPGKPHLWRSKFMETWNIIQIEVAEAIRNAVADSSGNESTLGLMSSRLEMHSIEGRDWLQLFKSLSISGRVSHRPHFASYSDFNTRNLSQSSAMIDMQKNIRPPNTVVEPEIENFPFTQFSKSKSYTWAQMALAQVHGCDSLLLDLFPFSGNSPSQYPEIGKLLDYSKPSLDWLASNFPPNLRTQGVGVLWHPAAAKFKHTSTGKFMDELLTNPLSAANVLGNLGISFQMCPSKINALFGDCAWAFSNEELKFFVENGLWLDGEAAYILQERGLGPYLGIKHKGWWEREDINYSMHEVVADSYGLSKGFRMNCNLFSRVARIQSTSSASELTRIIAADGKPLGPALTVHNNTLGGRVAVSAFPLGSEEKLLIKSFQLQTLVQHLICSISGPEQKPTMISRGAYLLPIQFVGHEKRLVLINESLDSIRPRLRIFKTQNARKAYLLKPLKKPERITLKQISKKTMSEIRIRKTIPHLGMAIILFEQ